MPICHTKKIIFYHIPRCAGTSVEACLNINTYSACHGVRRRGDKVITLQHLTPGDMLATGNIDNDAFHAYFKFTIIRDPFERMTSDYLWQKKFDIHSEFQDLTFTAYLEKAEEIICQDRYFEKKHYDHFRPMIEYCFFNGELMVDDVLILENLENEIKRIQNVLGPVTLPRVNSSGTKKRALDNRENRERVYDIYAADKQFYDYVRANT